MSFTIREKNRNKCCAENVARVLRHIQARQRPDAVTHQIKDSQTLTMRVRMCL